MSAQLLLPLVVFTPLVGAALLALLPHDEAGQHKIVALITSLVTFGFSCAVFAVFQPGVAGFQDAMSVDLSWIPALGIRFHLAVDGISLFLLLLTTWLMPIVLLSSFTAVEKRTKEFYISMLLLQTAMLGAFVAIDLILFYVFWELMLIPMYLLIGVFGGERRIYAAMKFFVYTMVGSLLMLLAILYLYFKTGSFDFVTLLDAHLSLYEQRFLFWAFVLAFAVKVPIFPLHTWLPDAHVQAPTAASVILAGVMLKMGSYGLMRFAFPLFPEAAAVYAPVIAFIGVVGIIYGALMAIAQTDAKKLVAYSSVSHMGFIILGLCVFTTNAGVGAVYQMLNHGVSSGALFLLVGILYERRHTREMSEFGGIAKSMPAFAAFFMFIALSSAGLPGTNGFVGEFLILLGAYSAAPVWARWATGFAGTGVILGAVYLLWMYRRIFFGPLDNKKNQLLKDLSLREWVTLVPIAAVVLMMGLYPKPFLDRITPSVQAYVGRVLSVAAPGRSGGVAVATAEISRALGVKGGQRAAMGPGLRALAGGRPELSMVLARSRAWQADAPSPTPAAPTPRTARPTPVPSPVLRLAKPVIRPLRGGGGAHPIIQPVGAERLRAMQRRVMRTLRAKTKAAAAAAQKTPVAPKEN